MTDNTKPTSYGLELAVILVAGAGGHSAGLLDCSFIGDDMIGLSDAQLKIVMAAAADVPVEKRSQFLERIVAMLAFRGRGNFTDNDVDDVVKLACVGLVHESAA
jgi:hypothetical protein